MLSARATLRTARATLLTTRATLLAARATLLAARATLRPTGTALALRWPNLFQLLQLIRR